MAEKDIFDGPHGGGYHSHLGLGAITPIGLTVEKFWTNLTAGVLGVNYITLFDAMRMPTAWA